MLGKKEVQEKTHEQNPDKLGALWLKTSKDGKTYLTGNIGEQKITVFENGYKDSEKKPDYLIFKSKPMPQK